MPKKQRILNQYVRHNAGVLTPLMIELIKRGDWRRAGASLLKCVSCGQYGITSPVVKFFDFNAAKILCYDCQNKQPSSHTQPTAVKDILAARVNS